MKSIKCTSSFCYTEGGTKYFNVQESYVFVLDKQTFLLCQSMKHDGNMVLVIMSAGYNFIVVKERHTLLA